MYFRDNLYVIKTLKEFQYIDEEGKDQGANVRQKAKDITNLLQDEGRLREERRNRAHMRDRMIHGGPTDDGGGDDLEDDDENARRRGRTGTLNSKRAKPNNEQDDLRRAIEESKRSLAKEQANKEEEDLEKALKLSEEEDAKRRKAVEDSNSSSLFDEQSQL
jgi:epsin